jgi:hypothetical protein
LVQLTRGASTEGKLGAGISQVMLGVMLPALWLPFCAAIYAPTYAFAQRGHIKPIAMATDVVSIGTFIWAMALAIPAGLFLQRRRLSPLFATGVGIAVSVVAFYLLLIFFWSVADSSLFGVLLVDPFGRIPLARLIAPFVVGGLAALALLVAANRSRN